MVVRTLVDLLDYLLADLPWEDEKRVRLCRTLVPVLVFLASPLVDARYVPLDGVPPPFVGLRVLA